MNNSKDDPRDGHLLAALRHAPDRDAVPPREVSERILAAARAAAESSRAAVRPTRGEPTPWWQRLSAWLMQPQVAASFGTLIVASLVGVMWSTREAPEPEFTPPPAAADRLAQGRMQAPMAMPQADAAKAEADVAAAPSTVPAQAPAKALSEARPKAARAPRPTQAAAEDAAARHDSGREAGPEARQRAGAAPPAETPTLRSAASPPAAAAAPAPQAADAAMPTAATAERRSAGANESRVLDLRREAAPKPASGAALGMALAAKAIAVADPLAQWDAALGVDASSNVRWRFADRRDAPPIAHGAAQLQWWAALRRATAGTWAAQTRASAPQPTWLAFDVSGSPAGSIDLASDAVLFCPAGAATCWRAPITAAQREAWTAEVARW